MRDVGEYLRAYWAYVSTHLGWSKALLLATCLAGCNVCTAYSEDVRGVAQRGRHTVDDWLGIPQLYFRAIRHVEGAAKKIGSAAQDAGTCLLVGRGSSSAIIIPAIAAKTAATIRLAT